VSQGGGDFGIVLALEEAEQAPLVSLEAVQALVDVGADPADRLIAAPGEEVLGLGVLEERVLAAVEVTLALGDQRRDPVRGAGVEAEGELDEPRELASPRHRPYLEPRPAPDARAS
jgi:hypothetical protein